MQTCTHVTLYQTFDKIPIVVYNGLTKQIFLNDFGETDCNIGKTLNLLMRKQFDGMVAQRNSAIFAQTPKG